MRNLKRALSLALASVMLLGMMVVGTSAASYPDVDENDNVEAIEVLNAVKVMIGDRGNFKPDAPVNRHEMAVIMAKLVLGNEIADNYVGTHPFTDVASWADKYVAACYENGIVYGTSKTTFGGDQPLTAVQAAAFMLRALGYKDLSKGASDWSVPVTAKANEIRLFNGVAANPKEQLTRNQVAQLALNTLKSPMVTLIDGTFTATDGDNKLILSGGAREYKVIARSDAYARAISAVEFQGSGSEGINGWTVELGEQLYNGKLRLSDNAVDDFGRPSRTWEYDGKEIGTYIKDELLRQTYTDEVTGKALYDLIGKATIDDTAYTFNIYIDGVSTSASNAATVLGSARFTRGDLARNNQAGVGGTGKGVLTQVFVDGINKKVDIVIVNTYLAKARFDYREKTDDVSLNVYAIDNKGNATNPVYAKSRTSSEDVETIRVLGEDFDIVKETKEKDLFLVTVAAGVVQSMKAPEVVTDSTVSAFKKASYVVADGNQYDYASTAEYDWEVLDQYTSINGVENLKDRRYNVILDKYGYLIGLELLSDAKNYAFVAGVDAGKSNLVNKTADINLIHLDGTNEVVKVDLSKSKNSAGNGFLDGKNETIGDYAVLNTWVTYTVNSNNVYTLNEVADKIDAAKKVKTAQFASEDAVSPVAHVINKKNNSLPGSDTTYSKVYGNNETVYLTAKLDSVRYNTGSSKYAVIISDVSNVATGIDNVDMTTYTVPEVKTLNTKFVNLGADLDAFSSGAYTLYNDKGYIIATMVVGKDNGANSNLVYVHTDDVEYEEYKAPSARANTGDWTWVRKVIYQGEEFSLTEAGDNLNYISADVNHGNMQKGTWQKVRFNANNEVIGADDVFAGKSDLLQVGAKIPGAGEYVTNPVNLPASYREYNTVVFQYTYTDSYNRPHLEGQTLFVTTGTETGVRVATDVKTVLFQTNNNKSNTYYYTTDSELKKVIDDLNKKENADHNFILNLVVLEGAVRYAVIKDLHEDKYTPSTPSEGKLIVDIDYNDFEVDGIRYIGDAPHSTADCLDAIIAELTAKGYTVTKTTYSDPTYTFTTKDKRGIEIIFTWNKTSEAPVKSVNITVDGTKVTVNSGENQALSTIVSAGKVTKTGTYAKQVTKDSEGKAITKWLKVGVDKVTPKEGDAFTFGYYAVTVTEDVTIADKAANVKSGVKAALKSPSLIDSLFAKEGKTDVVIVVTNGDNAIGPDKDGKAKSVGITSDVGEVTKGGKIDALEAKAKTEVTVQVNVTKDTAITLTASDYVAPEYVTINGTKYNVAKFTADNKITGDTTWAQLGAALNLGAKTIGSFVQITDAANKVTYKATTEKVTLTDKYTYLFDSFIGEAGLKDGDAEKNVNAVKAEVSSARDNQVVEKILEGIKAVYANVELKKTEQSKDHYVLTTDSTIQLGDGKKDFATGWQFDAAKKDNEYTVIPLVLKLPEGAMSMRIVNKKDKPDLYIISKAADDTDGDGVVDSMITGVLVQVAGDDAPLTKDTEIQWYADEDGKVAMGDKITYTITLTADQIKEAPKKD